MNQGSGIVIPSEARGAKSRDLVPVSDEISRFARNDSYAGFRIKSGMTVLFSLFSIFYFLFSLAPAWAQGVCAPGYCDQLCATDSNKTECLTGCNETCAQAGKSNIGCALPPDVKISPLLPTCTYWEGTPKSAECGCRNINDLVKFLINYGNFVIGGVGAIALLMFIYGGFVILTAAGAAERVGQGKKAIVAAVIGLVIVFGAQLIVRFAIGTLKATPNPPLLPTPEKKP